MQIKKIVRRGITPLVLIAGIATTAKADWWECINECRDQRDNCVAAAEGDEAACQYSCQQNQPEGEARDNCNAGCTSGFTSAASNCYADEAMCSASCDPSC